MRGLAPRDPRESGLFSHFVVDCRRAGRAGERDLAFTTLAAMPVMRSGDYGAQISNLMNAARSLALAGLAGAKPELLGLYIQSLGELAERLVSERMAENMRKAAPHLPPDVRYRPGIAD